MPWVETVFNPECPQRKRHQRIWDTRYIAGLMSLTEMSAQLRRESRVTEATGVLPAYLAKVLQSLRKAGIVHSRRGRGGGISLARQPEDLTILEIVNAVDPLHRIKKCPIGLAKHGVELCPMHSRLDETLAMTEEIFRKTTLADLLSEGTGRGQRCKFPVLKK